MSSKTSSLTTQRRKNPYKRAPGRPTLQDVEDIERFLLDAALTEFVKNGYGGTSMQKIAKAANISKTTLYARHASKEDLFRAIILTQVEIITASLSEDSGLSSNDLITGLKSYANHMLKYSLEGELLAVNRIIYSESYRFPELSAAATERTSIGINRISSFIRERGLADGLPCKSPDKVAKLFYLMIRGWYVTILMTDEKVTRKCREDWVTDAVELLVSSRENW